jgi:hypothetical protein
VKEVPLTGNIHGRSGRVALPRTKLVLAMEAALFEAPALKAERAAVLVRKSVVDMIADVNCCDVIQLQLVCSHK